MVLPVHVPDAEADSGKSFLLRRRGARNPGIRSWRSDLVCVAVPGQSRQASTQTFIHTDRCDGGSLHRSVDDSGVRQSMETKAMKLTKSAPAYPLYLRRY